MLIKICGITNFEEIKDINELQPDYIGFVFTESKRKITIEQGRKLFNELNKNIKVVGVFRNNSLEEILKVLTIIPLDVVQLHGNEDEKFILALRAKVLCHIWKAVSINNKEDLMKALKYPVDTLILDGSNPGSGQVFPWNVLEGISIDKKIILAGGINEANVLEAISKVNPNGIDTSSGVEITDEKGRRKSKEKMEKLIRKVREINER